jgi:hypothetical protein
MRNVFNSMMHKRGFIEDMSKNDICKKIYNKRLWHEKKHSTNKSMYPSAIDSYKDIRRKVIESQDRFKKLRF